LRVAVYGEFSYRRDAQGLSTDQSFALFVARLGGFVERLLIVGRLDPKPGSTHHRLQGDFDFAELPDYASLGSMTSALRATLASIPRLWRSLEQVEVVWLLGPNPLCVVFALLARLRGRRVVLGVRQDIVALTRSRYGRGAHLAAAVILERIWRLIARRATVIAIGPELERAYDGAGHVVAISISLIDAEDVIGAQEAERRDYSGELTALSVGRLEAQKNPLLLADVLAELRQRSERWRLVICGEGEMGEALSSRLRALGVDGDADLRGYVPVDGPLSQLYRDSHAFLHVSWTEGFPQVLLEAFAAGLPVVATAVGGIEEWIGDCAVLVPAGDAAAAAEALGRLAADPQLRERIGERGRRFALDHSVSAECRRVVAALEE
jgi:glycosyltransferase involved in cell wall biosynthesis